MAQDATVDDILNRISALENANAVTTEDLSDPPFFSSGPNGEPISFDAIEKIPDYVRDLPVFTGDPKEVSNWISDVEGIVQSYKPKSTSTVNERNT